MNERITKVNNIIKRLNLYPPINNSNKYAGSAPINVYLLFVSGGCAILNLIII